MSKYFHQASYNFFTWVGCQIIFAVVIVVGALFFAALLVGAYITIAVAAIPVLNKERKKWFIDNRLP